MPSSSDYNDERHKKEEAARREVYAKMGLNIEVFGKLPKLYTEGRFTSHYFLARIRIVTCFCLRSDCKWDSSKAAADRWAARLMRTVGQSKRTG